MPAPGTFRSGPLSAADGGVLHRMQGRRGGGEGGNSERQLSGKSDSLVGAAYPEVHFLESCFANRKYHGIRHIHVSKTKVIPVDLLIPINAIWCLVWL
jgi:hypothetical protein